MRKVFLFLSLLLSTALLISGCQTQTNTLLTKKTNRFSSSA